MAAEPELPEVGARRLAGTDEKWLKERSAEAPLRLHSTANSCTPAGAGGASALLRRWSGFRLIQRLRIDPGRASDLPPP